MYKDETDGWFLANYFGFDGDLKNKQESLRLHRHIGMKINAVFRTEIDGGLLAMRVGAGISLVLLSVLKTTSGTTIFVYHPGAWPLIVLSITGVFVTFGFLTRIASGLAAGGWAYAFVTGLQSGQSLDSLPSRALMYAIIFATLNATGAGKFSIDYLFRSVKEQKQKIEI